jgi:hypothetical protein
MTYIIENQIVKFLIDYRPSAYDSRIQGHLYIPVLCDIIKAAYLIPTNILRL